MTSKGTSALSMQKQSFEVVKKKADVFLKDFKKYSRKFKGNTKTDSDEAITYLERCQELLYELEPILETVEKTDLDEEGEEDDLKRRKSFDSKKKHLMARITSLRAFLNDVQATLSVATQESVDNDNKRDGDTSVTQQKEEATMKKSAKALSAKVRESIFTFDRKKRKKDENKEKVEEEEGGKAVSAADDKDDGQTKGEKTPVTELIAKKKKREKNDVKIMENDDDDDDDDEDDVDEDDDDDEEEDESEEEEESALEKTEAVLKSSGQTKQGLETSKKTGEDVTKDKRKEVEATTSDGNKSKAENTGEDSMKTKRPFLQKFIPGRWKTQEHKVITPNSEETENIAAKTGEEGTIAEGKNTGKIAVTTPQPVPRTLKQKKVEEEQKPLVPIKNEKNIQDLVVGAEKMRIDDGDDDDDPEEESEEEESEEEEEEEEEAEEEEEEEEEEEDDDGEDMNITGKYFVALQDFEKQEEIELAFKRDQILKIVHANEDGWWEAMDTNGNKGLVPKTYLQLCAPPTEKSSAKHDKEFEEEEDDGDEDDDDEKEEDDDEDEDEDEEDEDDDEEEDDDDDDSKFVDDSISAEASVPKSRSGKKLWKFIQKSTKESSVVDVLHAMGAVPSGFRPSTLFNLYHASHNYRMSRSLHPNLSASALNFKDLFYSPSEKRIRPYSVNVQRIVTLVSCRYIPTIGSRLEVVNRTVRVCLFDGKDVLSNIHVIKASSVDKSQKTWGFSSSLSNDMDVSQHAEIFIRTNHTAPNIGLLFELGVKYIHTENKEHGEFSSGWKFLLLNEENMTLLNQNYDLYLDGGTPYERGVPLDVTASRVMQESTLRSMIYGHQKPMLTIKVANPKREQKDQLDCLPETIIGNLCLLPFYAIYRNILAKSLLWDRSNIDNTELLHSPILSTFPSIADQYELMQLLRDTWIEKQRKLSRGSKRDAECQRKLFVDVFMEAVYPMSHASDVSGSDNDEQRYDTIQKFKNLKNEQQSALAILLSGDISFEPIDLEETTFSIMQPFKFHDWR